MLVSNAELPAKAPTLVLQCNDSQYKSVEVQRVVADLGSYITRMGAARVVIDPVGPLLFGRESPASVLDQARMLFSGLQANTNTTNLLTTYSAGAACAALRCTWFREPLCSK